MLARRGSGQLQVKLMPTSYKDAGVSSPFRPITPQARDQSVCTPEKQSSELWIALFLFVITCAYLFLFRRYTTMDPDEGIVLQGAQRLLRGEAPYRDFFSFITPGSYYLLAGLFKIFGSSLLVGRTALVFSGGVFSVVTYLLARRVCLRWSALLTAAIVTVSCMPYRFLVLHNWDSTLWACLAVYCAVRLLEFPHWIWAFGAGSFASLTFLFEQSKGAGLILGLGVGFLAVAVLDRQKTSINRATVAGAMIGLAWPLMATFAYFSAVHGLSSMLADWLWPLRHYHVPNRVPYGFQDLSDGTREMLLNGGPWVVRVVTWLTLSPCFLVPVLPLIAVGLLAYWSVQMWRRRAAQKKCAHYILMSATLAGLLFSVVIVRADIIHFMYLEPLFAVVLAWIIDGRDIPSQTFRAAQPVLNAFLAAAFLAMSMALLIRTVNAPYEMETRRGLVRMPGQDTVVEYVQQHVGAGETILVYPYLPLYYYLTATYSPSRYEYLQPGLHTVEQSREMLSQLDSRRVRAVLFEPSFADKIPASWPETPPIAIANDPVADYILRNYRACKVLYSPMQWRFLYMLRKDISCD